MWQMLKDTFSEWTEDKVPRLSAALAFYTMLSLAPLLIILAKIISFVMNVVANKKGGQDVVTNYITSVSSPQTAEAITQIFKQDAAQPSRGMLASIISLIILLISASGVFGELQTSMNEIFDVKPRPNRGIMATIKDRFFSMTLVLGVAFLLLVSLIVSTVLSSVSHKLMPSQSIIWQIVNFLVSISIITVLFALIFKYLPDVNVAWKPVWVGAITTGILFTIGKWGLGLYLSKASTVSAYGAMGSLVALLLWVYYSSQIVFFGAEQTQVYAKSIGVEITPSRSAIPIEESDDKEKGKGKGEGATEQPWYPAVPARRELAVAPSYAAASGSNGGGGAGSKLLMLAAGVAVGKFILGGGGGKGGKKVKVAAMVEPGFVTRRKHYENKEYVLRFRAPKFVARAADSVQRGYERVKNRISEYIEK